MWILLDGHVGFAGGSVLIGDVNGDGTLTGSDALIILRCAMGIIQLSGDSLAAADYDGDGRITATDALIVLRISMGIS